MWLGDFAAGDTVDFKFTTRTITGAPTTLSGTPAVSVYKSNGDTESTAGVTLTANFDSRTGLNHVRITTSSDGTFYANGSDFQVVITTGTVGGTSVVGEVVGHFSLKNRNISTTAINSIADQVWDEAVSGHTSSGTYGLALQPIRNSLGTWVNSTTFNLDGSASTTNDYYNGCLLFVYGTHPQVRLITDYDGASQACTVSPAFTTAGVGGALFVVMPFGYMPGLSSDAITNVWSKTMTELSSVPGVTGTTLEALQWLFLLARNKVTQTSTTQTLRNDADSSNVATSTHSDDGTTHTRGEWS